MTRRGPGFLPAFVLWVALELVGFLTIWSQRPPPPVPATAAVNEFSAERALRHVEAIARAPRPIGSANHGVARDYISKQLRAFGLEPEVQKTTAIGAPSSSTLLAGTIENVVARKKGSGRGHAVLLVAHYDSVPTGPGANDDAVGVATLLETARALSASPQLGNDIIFLFTDSEETGLLGARAFLAEHPWAKEVGVVLNFEGRGNGGPVIMFETSPQNGGLIRALASATTHPLANSLSYEIYKRLPNSTDLTVFKTAGMPAMNFAFIGGATHYHTALDNLENVGPRTVQHHGSYALALSRYFGADMAAAKPEGDSIYFDGLGFWLVRYPAWLAGPFAVGVLLLFAIVVRLGFRRNELTGRGIGRGALLVLASLLLGAAAVAGAWWLIGQIHPEYRAIAQGDSYDHGLYVLGFAALSLATTAGLFGSLGRRITGADLLIAALLWWAVAMVALTVFVIGGSYLATWPLFFALLGLAWRFARPTGQLAVAALAAVPGILLVAPFVHLVLIAMPFALAPALVLPLVLLWTLLIPLLRRSTIASRWMFPGIVGAIALLFFVLAGRGRFDRDHRGSNHLLYVLNAATQGARWVSADPQPDGWTARFLGKNPHRAPLADAFPLGRRAYLQAPAPVVSLPAPEARLLDDVTANGVRRLRFRLSSPRGAERISVQINAEILNPTLDGKPIPATEPQTSLSFIYLAPPKDGVELAFETKAPGPLSIQLADESYGLPLLEGATSTDRPEEMMPAPFFRSDFTIVTETCAF
jgi:hypothetical protein